MNNLLSYFGLVDARISASEKDLPVPEGQKYKNKISFFLDNRRIVNSYLVESNMILLYLQEKISEMSF